MSVADDQMFDNVCNFCDATTCNGCDFSKETKVSNTNNEELLEKEKRLALFKDDLFILYIKYKIKIGIEYPIVIDIKEDNDELLEYVQKTKYIFENKNGKEIII